MEWTKQTRARDAQEGKLKEEIEMLSIRNLVTPLLCLVAIASPVWLMMAQEPQTPTPQGTNWQNTPAHQVPHCDIPARAAKDSDNVAPCKCPGKVNIVQTSMAEACWVENGILIPEDAELRTLIMSNPSDEVLECLGKVPDHCEVVAGRYIPNMPRLDRLRELGYTDAFKCMTACKPERCGCADSSCKPHGPTQYQRDSTDDNGMPYEEYQ